MRTHLDLFSGIGGFALAANWAGFTTVGFVEYEDFPKRLLSRRFPCIPIHSDIHDFDATPFRGVDLITGGFPCQPFSAAGKQRGKEDDRYLWKEMLRVIVEAQPTWVLAENVAGIINMALDEVLLDLEAQDYATGTVILPACSQNALHRRDRVWIIAKSLAHSEQQGLQGHVEQQTESTDAPSGCSTDTTLADTSIGRGSHNELQTRQNEPGLCGTDVGDTDSSGMERSRSEQQTARSSRAGEDVAHSDSERRRLRHTVRQDAEDAWESSRGAEHGTGITESRMGIPIDGLSEGLDMPRRWGDGSWEDGVPRVTVGAKNRTQRLKALGNSILPQVAYEIIRHFD